MQFRSLKALALLILLLFVASACSRGASVSISESGPHVARCGTSTARAAADGLVDGVPVPNADFRSQSLCGADLLKMPDRIWTLTFDTDTVWPEPDKLPADFTPDKVMAWGKAPGLGIAALHQEGLTGKGVNVAYVDQPLLLGHQGLKGIDLKYTKVRLEPGKGDTTSMHGPAVASLLAGPEIGVAPDVTLYYYAHPTWLTDQTTHADALREVIKQNRALPAGQKIRAVGFSDAPDPREKNIEAYQAAIQEAEAEGILVVDVQHPFFPVPITIRPFKQKDQPENWEIAAWAAGRGTMGGLLVPTGGRTTAVGYPEKPDAYAYWTGGGLSWSVPYVVGTLALGWQVDPNLSNADAVRYLKESATPFKGGGAVINPRGFVEMVKQNRHP